MKKEFYIRYAMSVCIKAESEEEAMAIFEDMDLSRGEFIEVEHISEC